MAVRSQKSGRRMDDGSAGRKRKGAEKHQRVTMLNASRRWVGPDVLMIVFVPA